MCGVKYFNVGEPTGLHYVPLHYITLHYVTSRHEGGSASL